MQMENRNLEEVKIILTEIFPSYAEQLAEDEKYDEEWGYTLHSLFRDFIYYFSKNIDGFSEKQLNKFAAFVNEAVEKDDDLENAISTCFLEHLYQVNIVKPLKPLLSKQVNKRGQARIKY